MIQFLLPLILSFPFLFPGILFPEEAKEALQPAASKELQELSVERRSSLTINGKVFAYKSKTGNLVLRDLKGDAKATIFYVSYTEDREEGQGREERPITFCFNGGPGSASLWLQIGMLGPRRVKLVEEGFTAPPYQLVDNSSTILDKTDLVFIDPVSTGFSRPAPGMDAKQFHGVDEDTNSIAEFIRLFVSENNRWGSPKFLLGESYGTVRAIEMAKRLQQEHFLDLNGILLISSVLNSSTIRADWGDDLSFVLFLPTYTATAWYHKKLAPELQKDLKKTLDEAEKFASGEYLLALFKGDLLSTNERSDIAKKIAKFTGLSEAYVERSDLRVESASFSKELLSQQRQTVGRFDSRYKGSDIDPMRNRAEYDPGLMFVTGPFTGAFNHYLTTELGWQHREEYHALVDVQPWNYGDACWRSLNVVSSLREVMALNPLIKIFVASGYFDLATPYFAAEYTFNHLSSVPTIKERITMHEYEAGHMMYLNAASREKLKQDIDAFIETH
jgi:carboxypeptidase C (cathepsin A)